MCEENKGGRPKKFDSPVGVNLVFETSIWREIQRVARLKKISASELVRQYVTDSLERETS